MGNAPEDALGEAAGALALSVDGMREDGARIPKPRAGGAIREARQDRVDMKNAIIATVSLLPPSKVSRVESNAKASSCDSFAELHPALLRDKRLTPSPLASLLVKYDAPSALS